MRVAVFGRTGQVAQALGACNQPGTRIDLIGREGADFTQPESVTGAVADIPDGVDFVVNAVAFTDVDGAEAEPETARMVNATSVDALARACAARDLPLVHLSTDYVFSGEGDRPWKPDDPTAPINVYGATKLEGEDAVRAAGGPHAILRVSWVFSATGRNFLKTMLRLAETRDHLRIVADQVGGPTPAFSVADTALDVGSRMWVGRAPEARLPSGTWHHSGAPDVSWADFAREIFAQAGRNVTVEDIASVEYPTPAPRPANSRLDCSAGPGGGALKRADWKRRLATELEILKRQ